MLVSGSNACIKIAIEGQFSPFFGHDVDDAASARCIVFRPRVRDHLHTGNAVRWDALKGIITSETQECCGPPVHQNGNVLIASQGDVAIDIYCEAGDLTQDVHAGSALRDQIITHLVNLAVQAVKGTRPACGDFSFRQFCIFNGQGDCPQV